MVVYNYRTWRRIDAMLLLVLPVPFSCIGRSAWNWPVRRVCAKEAEQAWRPAHALSHVQLQGARLSAKVGLWNLIWSLRFSTKNKEKETCAERGRESKSIQNCGKPFLSTTITTEIGLNTVCWNGSLWFLYESTIVFPPIQDQTNYIYTKSRCSIRASASFQCFSFGTCSHASRLIGPGQTLVLSTIKSFRRWSSSGVTRLLNSTAPTHALSVSQFFKKATERLKEVHELLRARRDSANLSPGLQDLWICLWNVGTLAEKNRKVVKKGFFRKDPYRLWPKHPKHS